MFAVIFNFKIKFSRIVGSHFIDQAAGGQPAAAVKGHPFSAGVLNAFDECVVKKIQAFARFADAETENPQIGNLAQKFCRNIADIDFKIGLI